ncbi:MAG: heme-binding domain-containing protein [Bacteroidia bacterium]|nr:heme-binding domain-containing protein [Bacteroidia bacterium]
MKFIKIIAWLALVALIVIQFFPITLNESDTVPQSDFMVENQVPATIKNRLQVSCYDCHSNNTDYPWYSKIQPAAWYLEDHIQAGKDELNFNEWDTYSSRRKNSKLRSIIKQIESGEMPMDSYTLIHRDAILSDEDKRMIIDYITALKDSLE